MEEPMEFADEPSVIDVPLYKMALLYSSTQKVYEISSLADDVLVKRTFEKMYPYIAQHLENFACDIVTDIKWMNDKAEYLVNRCLETNETQTLFFIWSVRKSGTYIFGIRENYNYEDVWTVGGHKDGKIREELYKDYLNLTHDKILVFRWAITSTQPKVVTLTIRCAN